MGRGRGKAEVGELEGVNRGEEGGEGRRGCEGMGAEGAGGQAEVANGCFAVVRRKGEGKGQLGFERQSERKTTYSPCRPETWLSNRPLHLFPPFQLWYRPSATDRSADPTLAGRACGIECADHAPQAPIHRNPAPHLLAPTTPSPVRLPPRAKSRSAAGGCAGGLEADPRLRGGRRAARG